MKACPHVGRLGTLGWQESTSTKTWTIQKASGMQKKRSHQAAMDICPAFRGETHLSLLAGPCCAPGKPLRGWKQGVPTMQMPLEPSGCPAAAAVPQAEGLHHLPRTVWASSPSCCLQWKHLSRVWSSLGFGLHPCLLLLVQYFSSLKAGASRTLSLRGISCPGSPAAAPPAPPGRGNPPPRWGQGTAPGVLVPGAVPPWKNELGCCDLGLTDKNQPCPGQQPPGEKARLGRPL